MPCTVHVWGLYMMSHAYITNYANLYIFTSSRRCTKYWLWVCQYELLAARHWKSLLWICRYILKLYIIIYIFFFLILYKIKGPRCLWYVKNYELKEAMLVGKVRFVLQETDPYFSQTEGLVSDGLYMYDPLILVEV